MNVNTIPISRTLRIFCFCMTMYCLPNQLFCLEANEEDSTEFHHSSDYDHNECEHLEDHAQVHSFENHQDPCEFHQEVGDPTEYHSASSSMSPEQEECPLQPFDSFDLENNAQHFVHEVKEIKIPEFPYAFNPSIAVWNNQMLLCFRIRDSKTRLTNKIGFIWLDENLNPASQSYVLNFPAGTIPTLAKEQDPRLVNINDHLYIVYSDALKGVLIPEVRRMFVAEIHFDGTDFFADPPEGLFYFENENERRWEKNWTPFNYQGNLLLTYSLRPHRILSPSGQGSCATIASTSNSIKWDWGILRGGTPALHDGNQYLAFFHSSTSMATHQSNGIKMNHYFMGAYTFSDEPPFHITHISPSPIIGKGFYSSFPYKTWRPLRVVFPGGFIIKGNDIWIVYGKQDFEIWVVKLDKKGLLQSLIPVSSE